MTDPDAPKAKTLDTLLVAHLDTLAAIVRKKGRHLLRHETAEDLVQGMVASALQSAGGFEYQGDAQLLGWLRKVAERYIRDRSEYWNADKRTPLPRHSITTSDPSTLTPARGVNPPARAPGPATGASQKDEVEAALRAIATLSQRDREILQWLKEGVEPDEMADLLGVSLDAARQAKRRAIERFRDAYKSS